MQQEWRERKTHTPTRDQNNAKIGAQEGRKEPERLAMEERVGGGYDTAIVATNARSVWRRRAHFVLL